MTEELPKRYESGAHEGRIYGRWIDADAFAAIPDGRARRYVIMMPLPNVTGALHMGHAMDNVMQDLLDPLAPHEGRQHPLDARHRPRRHRAPRPWSRSASSSSRARPATTSAARAWWRASGTGRTSTRSASSRQQQAMGCSCDWKRQRFTMDPVCARAVRQAFFRLFRDGLIFRGKRLVNWDCQLQTAVSDDEIVYETVQGHFWHLSYPIIDPKPGRARLRGRGHHPARDDAGRHGRGRPPRPGG